MKPLPPVTLEVGSRDYATPEMSAALIYGVNLGLPAVIMLVLLVALMRHWRKFRLAQATEKRARETSAEPTEGEALIVGKVAEIEGDGPAIRLRITQLGVVKKKDKRYETQWREVGRELTTSPFFVDTDAGARIRIEPDDRVRLVDDLDTGPPREDKTRLRTAEVTIGETVYATGMLTRLAGGGAGTGYRGGAGGWTLRPPPGDAAMDVSTKPLTDPFTEAVVTRFMWIVFWLIVTLIVQAIAIPYHLSRWYGQDEIAVVTAQRQKHAEKEHYHRITVKPELGGSSEEIAVSSHVDYARLAPGARVVVNVRRSDDDAERITLESGARANKSAMYFPAIAIVVLALLCLWLIWRSKSWYDKDAVHDSEPGQKV